MSMQCTVYFAETSKNNSNNNNKIRISCENTVRFSKSEKSVSFDFRQVLSALNASTHYRPLVLFPDQV